MKKISEEEITTIHNLVVKQFKIADGTINKGILDAIVQRPDTIIGKDFVPYDNVYSRAASLLEGIIRWHPFADGNKRTALLTMVYYLKLEGYGIILSLNTVRYSVKIAEHEDKDENDTKVFLKDITLWIKNHSGKTKQELNIKIWLYVQAPNSILRFLLKLGFKNYVVKKVSNALAFDIYPEYINEIEDIIEFMNDILRETMKPFLSFGKNNDAEVI